MEKKNAYTREDLLACGRGELFGPGFGKLPKPNMLMADRITDVSEGTGTYGKGSITAELDINPDLWFFNCHFQDDPVMPGCLGLDSLWQLTGFFLTWSGFKGKGRALGVADVKFTGQVLPTNKLVTYKISMKRIIDRQLTLAYADGVMSVDGKDIYETKNMRVALFTSDDAFGE
ncbi:MAG: 3-hydroxyacyl-[acyl-carrier protein] dehydratase/trans-2-decenoyl-[acyl-carrier protein] isomerase [Kiritimatiellia bacterium]|jgi:3-hydroxyacyl-[acyl-carrier protein] dehydratase / trans-2-decenoyl-[acyl-carrier protein] isomerase